MKIVASTTEQRHDGIQRSTEGRIPCGTLAQCEDRCHSERVEGHDRGDEGVGELLEVTEKYEDHAEGAVIAMATYGVS